MSTQTWSCHQCREVMPLPEMCSCGLTAPQYSPFCDFCNRELTGKENVNAFEMGACTSCFNKMMKEG